MELLENIKLASFDLDDTLLVHGVLSENNKQAIIDLHNAGCVVVINTGRGLKFVPEVFFEDFIDYIITSNGSRIYDNHLKEYIVSTFIDSQDVSTIYSLIKKQHIIKTMCDEATYVTKDLHTYYIYQQIFKKATYKNKLKNILNFIKKFETIKDYQGFIDSKPQAFKMEFNCNSKTDPNEMVKKINSLCQVEAVVVKEKAIELVSNKAGKGRALITLAEKLDISIDTIAAFGDSGNDIDALKVAKFAVAMGNGTEPIKNAANIIIGEAKDDGIAKYINSIIK